MAEEKPRLPFHNLADRHYGITKAIADSYTEAARVCLDRHHMSPVEFMIDDNGDFLDAVAEWKPPDDRTKGAWANETDATRDGAYACALAAAELKKGMVAIRRAETRTGADYYVAQLGEGMDDLENCYRLEVSGIDKGSSATLQQRLRDKLNQAARGASNLPALAGVVGFRAKLVLLQPLEK